MNQALSLLYTIFFWIMLFRMMTSLLPTGDNSAVRLAYNLTEPILAPVRKVVGVVRFGDVYVDLSPIIVLLLLNLLRRLL